MPELVCPHCHIYANFRHEWSNDTGTGRFQNAPEFSCCTCDHCKYPIVAMLKSVPDANFGFKTYITTYWPTATAKTDYPDVPESIAGAANEAHLCLAAGSPHGAVALARAVVESVAKERKITKGNLEKKVDTLHSEGYIGESMKEAAHEIRFAGNEAAHGDLVAEPLTAEDAEKIVHLMDMILGRIYQEPAEVERIRQRRETRKAKPPAAEEDLPAEDPWTADPSDGFVATAHPTSRPSSK